MLPDPIKVKSAKTTSIIEALESKVGPRVEEGVPPSPDAEPAADAPQTDTGDSYVSGCRMLFTTTV